MSFSDHSLDRAKEKIMLGQDEFALNVINPHLNKIQEVSQILNDLITRANQYTEQLLFVKANIKEKNKAVKALEQAKKDLRAMDSYAQRLVRIFNKE